ATCASKANGTPGTPPTPTTCPPARCGRTSTSCPRTTRSCTSSAAPAGAASRSPSGRTTTATTRSTSAAACTARWGRICPSSPTASPPSSEQSPPTRSGRDQILQQGIADEGEHIDQGVGDHQRQGPAGAPVPLAEHQPHPQIRQARTDALIGVVRPAQQSRDE